MPSPTPTPCSQAASLPDAGRQPDGRLALGRALLAAEALLPQGRDEAFLRAKIATARFYADHLLVRTGAQRDAIVEGAASVTALALEAF